MSVKVGVRVRPFNKRELQLSCRRCVQMQGHTTRLIDNQGNVKNFVFDYSFWSHDKFMVDPDGIFIPVDDKYADQQKVYKQIGSDILINAWQGYNCCLFAYGQTGSGKSYSMIGYGPNKGIIPIVCDEIFKKISMNKNQKISFQVMVSMMEIYNQAVRDLLQKNKKKELKICQSKKLGVYVEGLYKHPVHSYEEIAKKIQEGSNNRSIAATLMNQSSSRSHTIVSINFVQKIQLSAAQTSIKYSVINLVDLAGSECVAKTGIDSKDRLRETAKINQSLSTLGRVIQILADNATKIQKQFVPYRDSKLTFILRNALGGNSRTAMICAISPADDNMQQTLSTLRYAHRAKNIQNKAIVNQSDVDKLIRMLRQQNQMLKKMLQQAKFTKTVINQEVISNYNRMSQNMVEMGLMGEDEDNLLNQIDIGENDKSNITQTDIDEYDQSEQNASMIMMGNRQSKMISQNDNNKNNNLPYITNISEDQLLSFRVKYCCEDLIIGNKQGQPKPDVVLAALGIQPNHARIYIDSEINGVKQVFLEILTEQAEDYTYLNGQNVNFKQKKQLFDNDRLIFGTSCIFLVVIFGGPSRYQHQLKSHDNSQNLQSTQSRSQKDIKIQDIDYQFAIKQMQNVNLDKSKLFSNQNQQQLRKKIVSEVQKEYEDIKKINEQNLRKQIDQQQQLYQEKIKQIQNKKNEQAQRLKQQLERKHSQAQKLQQQRNKVKQQIQRYCQMQRQMQLVLQQQAKQQQINKNEQITKSNQQLQKTNIILVQKMSLIRLLQSQIGQINKQNQQKQRQIKTQLQQQQHLVQRQLQVKTIMCQNQNILTQYKLQLLKRTKNAKQLRDLLIKKQKAFLQKQLIQLVPMIEKFNLMGKEMRRRIEAGLSIEYKYISEGEMIDALKNNSYKSKLKILIHVINKEELRGYYWSTEVFKNRFEHAVDAFELYISNNLQSRQSIINMDKYRDPYWQPQSYEIFGLSYLSLQCLLYQFSYNGVVTIVNQGKKVGQMEINLYPLINQGGNFVRFDNFGQDIKIFNPRDLIERSQSFQIQIQNIRIFSNLQIQKIKIEYQLLESHYKIRKYHTNEIELANIQNFVYLKSHAITQISENTILHYTDRPVAFHIVAMTKLSDDDDLTNRQSFASSRVSSFMQSQSSSKKIYNQKDQNIFNDVKQLQFNGFTEVNNSINYKKPVHLSDQKMLKSNKSGVIVQNTEIISKIQNEFQKKKKQNAQLQERKRKISSIHTDEKRRKRSSQKCIIF